MRFFSTALVAPLALFAPLLLVPACSDDPGTSGGGSTGSTTSEATTTTGATGSGGGSGGSAPVMITEKLVDVALTLSGATLTLVVKDGATPVMTDAWLYTLQNGTTLVPLTAFDDPAQPRQYRGRMLPCTLSGKPSGLTPCFNGELNGVVTDVQRSKRVGGVLQPDLDGTVIVPLSAAPVDPIVVLVGVEDQRYAGVAAIDVGGKAIAAPPGLAVLETHVARTYAKDAAPIFNGQCILCHSKSGAFAYMPLDTYDNVASFNFGTQNQINACNKSFPDDAAARQACVDAITAVEFYFEPGAPAVSPGLRRTRPDELQSTSPEGLAWYGGASRFAGTHGDRRMPPQNITADVADDQPLPTYFDKVPGDYQILFDWVAQGMMP